nr:MULTISPECIES: hypothetical protein [unclassified Mycolicibacterium]
MSRAAAEWTRTAEDWEETFAGVHRGALAPGGTEWQGLAAEAAQERTMGDLVEVRGLSDTLHMAATLAQRGADQLEFLKGRAVHAIDEARGAGFIVGEDLSVTDASGHGSSRITDAQRHAATISARAAALRSADVEVASKITAATTELKNHQFTEKPQNIIQAVDFKEAPPPGYPINDVIAESTDLDGNHVVLRRGYYDGKRGFGWDKIFHKHGITNPNVFNDLISHSRPISSKDGELIYKVPINRVHCASHLGGLYTSCDDTGESLEMMIVVDTTQNRWDVPDGGQKGVITMYPLPGGSGVVEVAPNWTMAPPWVSNNVPIN